MRKDENEMRGEKSDQFWYRVYAAVIVTNILAIAALWLFSIYFSR